MEANVRKVISVGYVTPSSFMLYLKDRIRLIFFD